MIIERNKLEFGEAQIKMIKSGWGASAIEETIVEKITYLSDGLKVKGYVAYPRASGKFPCIIWCRGGYGGSGAIDSFTARGIFGQLASWGYVVLSTQYRGSDGGEGKDEFGGGDLNDILNLIPLAEEIEKADTSRWAIEGWSRGGMMTYLALTKTNIFRTAIVTGGITDLRCNANESAFMRKLYESYVGNVDTKEFNELCDTRSIVKFPEKLADTPILIIHGNADNRVLPHDSLDLAVKLIDLKRKFRLIMLEEGDHFLKKHRKEVDSLRKEWFARFLS